ncbi:alpha/beta fold hydrolase [Cryptosporangium minutisporangium]|uniref:3-oxoadipate enol-lactonase n=1 Tax=Cryptosporangium minutisporangium TaxID=113569 RepID=A0ABP6T6H6_9ACTN
MSPGRPAIVLLNSLGTTAAMWDRVVPRLAESFEVLRYDQRGHGNAPVRPTTGLDDLVDDLLGVLDRRGVARVHLAGISIGGMIALRAASRVPDRVASVTALCCAAALDRRSWTERARTVREHGLDAIVPAVIERWFTTEFRSRRPEAVRASTEMLRSTPREGYAVGCDVLAEADVRADLPGITARTLVVGGAEDPATPPDEQHAIARAIPHAHVEILPAVAHLAPIAEPETIAKLITANALAAESVGEQTWT